MKQHYIKAVPEARYLPANAELAGFQLTAAGADEDYNIWRYPEGTTVHFRVMMYSRDTYAEAENGPAYTGEDAPITKEELTGWLRSTPKP